MADNRADNLQHLPMHPALAVIVAVCSLGPIAVFPFALYKIYVSGIPKVCFELPFWVWPALALTVAMTSAAVLAAVFFLPAVH